MVRWDDSETSLPRGWVPLRSAWARRSPPATPRCGRAWLSPRQFRLDAELGLDRPPFAEVLVGREGGARLRFDRHGLNNDDAAWDRPGPRVAILGDSFVEAVEVPRAENAVARLGAALPGATVLNLGRAAATPPRWCRNRPC